MGLLLFWNGIVDGVGDADAISVLSGDGLAIRIGTGAIAAISELTGSGAILHLAVGTIPCLAALAGVAILRARETTYLFTVVGQNGEAYSMTASEDVIYSLSRDGNGGVEYEHKTIGRRIP